MNKKLLFSIIFSLIYAVITLIAVFHHEIWADEAQVWLLCKNLSLAELINHLQNEGHPSFFYIIIMPFAKLFSNIIYMQLVCWFFMCLSAFILLYKSPFHIITKFSILVSAGFLYFLPVMARNYSILPFLIFLAAILYSKRKEHPVYYALTLFCIANTHAIMIGFVGILFLLFITEIITKKDYKKVNIISALIMLIGLLAVLIQLHETTQSNVCIVFSFDNLFKNILRVIVFFFINSYNYTIEAKGGLLFPLLDIPAIFAIFITFNALLINLYLNNKKLFLIALIGIGTQFAIYILAYNAFIYVTRIFIAYSILLFCFWILYNNNEFNSKYKICSKKVTTILLSVLFILTAYNGINYYIADYKYNYAGAKETAEFIQNNIDSKSLLLIDNEPYMVSLIYYLKGTHNLFSPYRNKNIRYVIWDKLTSINIIDTAWLSYIEETKAAEKFNNIYIIRSDAEERIYSLEKNKGKNLKKIFSSGYIVEGLEGYQIYEYVKNRQIEK